MSDIQTLRSYLVSLGFGVNTSEYKKFLHTLGDAADFVDNKSIRIVKSMFKWETAVVGMFAAVAGATVTLLDKVSMADQGYRLLGERMFMDTNHARALKVALDALGEPLEAIAFDPELHNYFTQLQKDQKNMALGLGPDFEDNMRKIRQIRFEFVRLKVEAEYFFMGAANQIFKALGLNSDSLLQTLQNINNYIQAHLPEWSRLFATYLVPILKDAWMIGKDVFNIFKDLALTFTNLVATLSGDSGLAGQTFSFEKFAGAIDKVAHAVAVLVHWLLELTDFFVQHPTLGGAATGALLGSIAGPEGAAIGAIAGGTIGGATELFSMVHGGKKGSDSNTTDIADQARALAQQVSAKIGVPADVIFAQWAHETGGFTNRGATQLNNLAGIRDGLGYRSFGSLNEFASYYSNLISSKRYSSKGALNATNTDQFAAALKAGGYYEDSYANYSSGMKHFEPSYSGGNQSTVTVGDIHINQPNATPDEIKNSVLAAALEARAKTTQRNLAQLTPAYP